MLISAKENLLVHQCLRCWDQHDEVLQNVVWFNTDTLMASVRNGQDEAPVRVSRFVFLGSFPTTRSRLLHRLPEELHEFIQPEE